VQAPQCLGDAVLGERLQEVIDDAELEGFDGVPVEGRGKHEHRGMGTLRERPDEVDASLPSAFPEELHVDEHGLHADAAPLNGLAGLLDARYSPHDLREP
jgi:hypothetical protein